MDYYSIWPVFGCLAILLTAASVWPFGSADIPPGKRQRISVLDGLRGFLALGVFFHHAAIYHRYVLDDVWALPPSAVFTLFGQVGVSMFFMITGYLFWSRMIAECGRPDWMGLYISRIFRIGPLYLVAVGTMLATVFVLTDFRLNEPTYSPRRKPAAMGPAGFHSRRRGQRFCQPWPIVGRRHLDAAL